MHYEALLTDIYERGPWCEDLDNPDYSTRLRCHYCFHAFSTHNPGCYYVDVIVKEYKYHIEHQRWCDQKKNWVAITCD